MASLTAGLVVVLIVLGVGVTPGNGDVVGELFNEGNGGMALTYFLKSRTMRIISSQDSGLSLAVSGGTVVVAATAYNDRKQAWIQDNTAIGELATEVGCRRPFALVNFDHTTSTLLAIVPPSNNPSDPAELAEYNPFSCVRPSMLWTQGTTNSRGFYTIQMFGDESRAFNSLGGVFEGAQIGVRPTAGINPNVLWKIVPYEQ